MQKTKIIGFYGYSDSGKTNLIESLCKKKKKKGLKVGVIKQSDKSIRMDQPGKDTYRFQEAGAITTALVSQDETDIITRKRLAVEQVIRMMQKVSELDLVIIESVKDEHFAKIRLGDIEERKNTIWTYDGNYEKLLNLIQNI